MTRIYSTARPLYLCFALMTGCEGADPSSAANTLTHTVDEDPIAYRLPKTLHEISGLAPAPGGRLYAVADEVGRVFTLDPKSGGVTPAFEIGQPVIEDDFEGIASHAGKVWLTNSDGLLYAVDPDGNLPPDIVDTGLGALCEIEGLTYAADPQLLFFACKQPRRKAYEDRLSLFAWSPAAGRRSNADVVVALKSLDSGKRLHPSGVTTLSDGTFLIIAARERRWIHIDTRGLLLSKGKLDKEAHPQAEGIATLAHDVYIADEDKKHGRLHRYSKLRLGVMTQ